MPQDQSPIDSVEIEPLSSEDLEDVAGGNDGTMTSDGPTCCSIRYCSGGGSSIEPINP